MRDLPVRQLAYFVPDIRAAAIRHSAIHGSGPFLLADHIPLVRSAYRGVEDTRPLDHSAAYGWCGELMIEFVQQNDAAPSAFHDLYPPGSDRFGLHHVAVFVDCLPSAIARFNGEGYATALDAETANGLAFAMIDTAPALGHMTELYEGGRIGGFYAQVRAAAATWDGQALLRPLSLG